MKKTVLAALLLAATSCNKGTSTSPTNQPTTTTREVQPEGGGVSSGGTTPTSPPTSPGPETPPAPRLSGPGIITFLEGRYDAAIINRTGKERAVCIGIYVFETAGGRVQSLIASKCKDIPDGSSLRLVGGFRVECGRTYQADVVTSRPPARIEDGNVPHLASGLERAGAKWTAEGCSPPPPPPQCRGQECEPPPPPPPPKCDYEFANGGGDECEPPEDECESPEIGTSLSWTGAGNPDAECARFGDYIHGTSGDGLFKLCKAGTEREVVALNYSGETCPNGKEVSHFTKCICAPED